MIDRSWIPPRITPVDDGRASTAVQEVIDAGPFTDTWDSLTTYRPASWFGEAKFGIFLHWGVYSVPAFSGEWYSRWMYIEGTPEYEHHRETYGPQSEFGYKDFVPMSVCRTSIPTSGPRCSADREHSMWFRSPSITTATPCTEATAPGGTPRRPGPIVTCSAILAHPW